MKSAWPAAARWHPAPTTAPWQWQLQGKTDTSFEAGVYDVDGFETPTSVVRRLHARGRHVVCYLDVGSWESFRPDAGAFPRSVIGRRYEGFPNERWLDVRRFHLFAKPLERRFDICARKGFDAVEPDNIAGWENKTGFPIGAGAQLRFNRWVARQVHSRGMAVALKNDGGQVRQLLGSFDFAIVEQCFQYEECGLQAIHQGGQGGLRGRVRTRTVRLLRRRRQLDRRGRPCCDCAPAAILAAGGGLDRAALELSLRLTQQGPRWRSRRR